MYLPGTVLYLPGTVEVQDKEGNFNQLLCSRKYTGYVSGDRKQQLNL